MAWYKAGGGSKPKQTKTVTPSTGVQEITADTGKELEKVTVQAMPSGALKTPTINTSTGVVTSGVQTSGYLPDSAESTLQLSTQGAKTVTPTTSNQTAVAKGKYTTGAITVKGDANLKAENIAKGTSIFGVNGTSTPLAINNGKISAKYAYGDAIESGNFVEFKDGLVDVGLASTTTESQYPTYCLPLDNNRVLSMDYHSGASPSYNWLKVIDYSTNPISVGTAVSMVDNSIYITGAYLGNNIAILFYTSYNTSDSSYPIYYRMITINEKTVTVGSKVTTSLKAQNNKIKCYQLTQNKLVLAYTDITTYCSSAVVLTISGSSVSTGTALSIDRNGNTNFLNGVCCEPTISDSLIAMPFNCSGNWNKMYLISCSGASLTLVTNYLMSGTSAINYFTMCTDRENGRMIYVANSTVYVYSVTSSGFTEIGHVSIVSPFYFSSVSYIKIDSSNYVFAGCGYTNGCVYLSKVKISGSSVTMEKAEVVFLYNLFPSFSGKTSNYSYGWIVKAYDNEDTYHGLFGHYDKGMGYAHYLKPNTYAIKSVSKIDGVTLDDCTFTTSGRIYTL